MRADPHYAAGMAPGRRDADSTGTRTTRSTASRRRSACPCCKKNAGAAAGSNACGRSAPAAKPGNPRKPVIAMDPKKPGLADNCCLRPNAEPLRKRLPTHDSDGRHLSDFMMLIPGLKHRSGIDLKQRLDRLQAVLAGHEDVVFADLNAPLNLLWVSVRTRHGVISDLCAAIRLQIPEARLVGHTAVGNDRSRRAATPAKTRRRRRFRFDRLGWNDPG